MSRRLLNAPHKIPVTVPEMVFDMVQLFSGRGNQAFLIGCWKHVPPLKHSEAEEVKGEYLEITEKGKELYEKIDRALNEKAKEDDDALALIFAVDLIMSQYIRLEWDELLFLLYTDETSKEFSGKSSLSKLILQKSEKIVDRLVKKGIIPEERREVLFGRAINSHLQTRFFRKTYNCSQTVNKKFINHEL